MDAMDIHNTASMFEGHVHDFDAAKKRAVDALPKGWFQTVPQFTTVKSDPYKGRPQVAVNTRLADPDGKTVGFVNFRISPVPFFWADGKADSTTTLWDNLAEVVKKETGQETLNGAAILTYLVSYPVMINVYPNKKGFLAASKIAPVKVA